MRHLITALTATAANGYPLADGAAARVALPQKTLQHLAAALKKQWRRYRRALRLCQERFSVAAVHDSRVETRRLLSIIVLISPFLGPGRGRKIHALLKRHLNSFDDLRDTQVQLSAASRMKRAFAAASRFCQYLRKREKCFARQTRRDINRVKPRRLRILVAGCRKDVEEWEHKDLPYAANALLLRTVHAAYARTQRLRDQIGSGDTKAIHRTRIAFKKFRYMVEILSRDLPHANKQLLRAMHDYQTMMGDIQDAQVLLEAFQEFTRKKRIAPVSARGFRHNLLEQRDRLVQRYLGAADQLLEFWPSPASAQPNISLGTIGRWGHAQSAHRRALGQPAPESQRKHS